MATMEFRTLGTLDLRRSDGTVVHSLLAQPKRLALLSYLCVASPRGFHRRDTLLGLFWPDADQAHARTSLRNGLHVLRQALGEAVIQSRGDEEIGVDSTAIWCDAVAFDQLVARGDVEKGLDLYQGDFFAGFFLEDVPTFERWHQSEQSRLRTAATQAARTLAGRRDADNDLAGAVLAARRAVNLAPMDEGAVRGLIGLLSRSGDKSSALQSYEEFARRLTQEFGAEPSIETRSLIEAVRRDPAAPRITPEPVHNKEFAPALISATSARASSKPPLSRYLKTAVAIAAASVLIVLGIWQSARLSSAKDFRPRLADRSLVTNTGQVNHSAISPNGRTLAYVTPECRTSGCAYALELKEIDGTASRVLIDGIDDLPPNGIDWSPDGSKLILTGRVGGQQGSFLVSALGGLPRRLGVGRFSFSSDGDSLLSVLASADDSLGIVVSDFASVPRDTIRLSGITAPDPGGGIGRVLQIPKSKWMAVAIRHGSRFQWFAIDRNGAIGDTLGLFRAGSSRASEDALWLGFGAPEPTQGTIVRIPFDSKRGRFGAQRDTLFSGNWAAFDVTPNGKSLLMDEGSAEFTGWALEVSDLIRGVFPQKRRMLTASAALDFEVSPDGQRILVGRAAAPRPGAGRRWDVMPFDGGPMIPFDGNPSAQSADLWADAATIPVGLTTPNTTELSLVDVNTSTRSATYVVHDTALVEATVLSTGAWVWVPWEAKGIRLHRPSGPGIRTVPFPKSYGRHVSLAPSPDGSRLLLVAVMRDTIRVSVMSLPDGKTTLIKSLLAEGAAFAVWLSDGSVMLSAWRRPDSGLTMYRLLPTGETISTVTVPHPVWSVSFSRDMKRAAVTVREYHGDASLSRVITN